MQIGTVKIFNKTVLAPMAGVTDLPFRLLVKREGCGLVYTEMISANGLYYENQKTRRLLATADEEKPVAVQIFGSDPGIMAKAAKIVSNYSFDIIDINMGCPTPKIVNNGSGAALMKDPDLAEKIIKSVVESTEKPVTVKIRKGWDSSSVNAVEIAQRAEAAGVKAIAIHGRTRSQFYSGKADWEIIKKVKEAVDIPVIGNGDVTSPEDAERMLQQTGCDAVMIGRGALGDPWIFSRVNSFQIERIKKPLPTPEEKILKAIEHLDMVIEFKGEKAGVLEMRKHIGWYLKGIKNSAKIKQEVFKCNDTQGMKDILKNFLKEIQSGFK
ncbi:MAG: tRNA-dihydrouridine synthase [Thermosediminibacterales bacterium]|nr:tRNA-dihydrouridine synthase [Thermosediminibacterales bacterium]